MKTLTNEERILKFAKKHNNIDERLLPSVYLTWDTKKKGKKEIKIYNTKTGKVFKKIPSYIKLCKKSYVEEEEEVICSYYRVRNKQLGIGCPSTINNKILVRSNSDLHLLYIKYDGNLKVAEISEVSIDTCRHSRYIDEDIRHWYRIDRKFIIRGDNNLYYIYHNKIKVANKDSCIKNIISSKTSKKVLEEFKKFANSYTYGSYGIEMNFHYTYEIGEWMKAKYIPIDIKDNKKWSTLDSSLIINNNSNNNICWYLNKDEIKRYTNDGFIYYETVTPSIGVFKVFFRRLNNIVKISTDLIVNETVYYEGYRTYFDNKGNSLMLKRISDIPHKEWGRATNIGNSWKAESFIIININDIKYHPYLKYIIDYIKENDKKIRTAKDSNKYNYKNTLGDIINMVNHPIIEKLKKAGYNAIAKNLLIDNSIAANIKEKFGETDKNKKSLAGIFGLNNMELKFVDSIFNHIQTHNDYGYSFTIVKQMKDILNISNLSNMNIEDFKILCKILEYYHPNYYVFINGCYSHINKKEAILLEYNTLNKALKFWKKIDKIGNNISIAVYKYGYRSTTKNGFEQLCDIIVDIYGTYIKFPNTLKPKLNLSDIKTKEDLERLHDEIVTLYNMQQEEIQNTKNKEIEEKMKKIDVKRKKLEYEDDNYIIRLPYHLSEITSEGRSLHHCVASYVERHALGETTILFLREKANPDKNFYTIEVKERTIENEKEKYVVQIHGFGNKWLGNNPEVVPFVMRWLRDKNISCEDINLLSTSSHYNGWDSPLIEKPII